MRKYMVYTANGDWVIFADSKAEAKRKVYNITLGRCGSIDAVKEVP